MSLLDLSVANVSVAQSPAPRRPASTSSLSSTPKPGVTDLIQKFSPNQTHTPLRRASMDNPGSATPKAMRRISPLPRRSLLSTPKDDGSPPRLGMKRKGSDPEIAFPEESRTPERERPTGPRFSQPLIAFSDSPARDASFVFGLASATTYKKMGMRRESTLHDLMSLANPSAFDVLATPAKTQAQVQPAVLVEEDDEDESKDADVTVSLISGTTTSTPLTWSTSSGPVEDLLDMDETAILTAPPVELVPEVASPAVLSPERIPSPEPESRDADSDDDAISEGDTIRESDPPKEAEMVTDVSLQPPIVEEVQLVNENEVAPEEKEAPEPELEAEKTENAEEISEAKEPADEPATPPATPASPVTQITPSAARQAPPTPRSVSAPVPAAVQEANKSEVPTLEAISETVPTVPEEPVAVPTEAEVVAPAKPNPLQTSQRSAPGPRRPANAPIRPANRTVSHPVEKKSFRPVSKLLGDKGAPAPAKLATKSLSTKEKEQEKGSLSTSQKRSASTMIKGSASAASTISKGTATTASTTGRAAGLNSSTRSSDGSAPSTRSQTRTTRSTASSLFKPTAATAARAAATAAKPEPAAKPPSRPGTAMSNASTGSKAARPPTAMSNQSAPGAATTAPRTRNTASSGLFASTAASRARNAEAALPPSKRQRVKLKAPMESFRPGRSANKSKAAVLGTSSASGAAGRRPVRATTRRDGNETFPLPGPGLSMSQTAVPTEGDKPSERSVRSSPADVGTGKASPSPKRSTPIPVPASPMSTKSSSLAIPTPSSTAADDLTRTPTSTSPIAIERLSPNSARTSRSQGSSPGSKIVGTLPKALDPVLTTVHPADVLHRTPSKKGESPAILHSRRISGIPPSLKKMLDAQKAEMKDGTPVPLSEGDEGEGEDGAGFGRKGGDEDWDDENVVVIRSDVSTPTGKSAAILARLSERGVLQDAN